MNARHIPNSKTAPSPAVSDDDGLTMFRQIAASVAHSDKKKTVPSQGSKAVTKRRRKAPTPRYRLRFSFWLNILNADEVMVADQIELFKNTREFTHVVRDGIMLVSDLRKGSSDMLVKLFDWLRAPLELYQSLMEGDTTMLFEQFPDIVPPPPVSPEKIKEMEDELKKLRKEHDVLEGQVEILNQVICNLSLPAAIDTAVKMAGQGQPAPVRTPRPTFTPRPPVVVDAAPVQEADTSSAFLDAF